MISVDIKALLRRMNGYCTGALESAAGLCVSRTHYEVTVEHMMLKLLEDQQADMPLILRHQNIDGGQLRKALSDNLEDFKTGNAAKPVFSPLLLEWLQEAWLTASVDLDEARIRSGALLLAFLNRPHQFPISVDLSGGLGSLQTQVSRLYKDGDICHVHYGYLKSS